MITLAFDSTARLASVAVVKNGRPLANYTIDNGLTQSELLLPMAEDMLRSLRLSIDDIDLFAVSVGPGSFTGVRIGVALIKGLAFGKGKPVAEVSTLEELAENLRGLDGYIVPVMDARRGQVYTAIFRGCGNTLERVTEDSALSIEELYEKIKGEKRVYLVGDGYETAHKGLTALGAYILDTPTLLRGQSAVSVALVGERMQAEGRLVSDTALKPTYLRMPQAERERLEKLKNT